MRFLKRTGPSPHDVVLNPATRDPTAAAFGYGRRVCPGQWMAYESMWITIASVLAVYDIAPPREYRRTHPRPGEELQRRGAAEHHAFRARKREGDEFHRRERQTDDHRHPHERRHDTTATVAYTTAQYANAVTYAASAKRNSGRTATERS